jgi:hypothetical protein|tara:strand:+ start:367 stop:486 length:120 start_codon:yes stop_codon:yes gene_type:complete
MHVINNDNQFGKAEKPAKEKSYGQQPAQPATKGRAQSHG